MLTIDFSQIMGLSKLLLQRSNKFVTISIALILEYYCSICNEFSCMAFFRSSHTVKPFKQNSTECCQAFVYYIDLDLIRGGKF